MKAKKSKLRTIFGLTAKAIESFESVARDGSQMNVNVIAYCKE